MLPIVRKNKIKEMVMIKKSITVNELTAKFQVTEETIRRDLKKLEDEGFLTRIYGGAYISDGVQNDVDINLREHIHVEGKRKIALKSLEYIKPGDSIFLDASTTSLTIASMLTEQELTIVTNSVKIASALVEKPNIQIILIGGHLSKSSLSNLGKSAEESISKYFFDVAFISSRSISMKHGITETNEEQATIKQIAAANARKVHLILDYTKFDRTSFVLMDTLNLIDNIIVDNTLSDEWHDYLREHNISVDESA